MIAIAWSCTTSIHHTLSASVDTAPIPVKAHTVKVPVTSRNFRNPLVGIAHPTALGADVSLAHTPSKYPLVPPCDTVVPIAGTFPVPTL